MFKKKAMEVKFLVGMILALLVLFISISIFTKYSILDRVYEIGCKEGYQKMCDKLDPAKQHYPNSIVNARDECSSQFNLDADEFEDKKNKYFNLAFYEDENYLLEKISLCVYEDLLEKSKDPSINVNQLIDMDLSYSKTDSVHIAKSMDECLKKEEDNGFYIQMNEIKYNYLKESLIDIKEKSADKLDLLSKLFNYVDCSIKMLFDQGILNCDKNSENYYSILCELEEEINEQDEKESESISWIIDEINIEEYSSAQGSMKTIITLDNGQKIEYVNKARITSRFIKKGDLVSFKYDGGYYLIDENEKIILVRPDKPIIVKELRDGLIKIESEGPGLEGATAYDRWFSKGHVIHYKDFRIKTDGDGYVVTIKK